jgi:xanthine dehydrogenase accessory factor
MLIIVRGAGDIASAVCHRFMKSGFMVVASEIAKPTVVRRTVSFAEAVFENEFEVEGIKAKKVLFVKDAFNQLQKGFLPILIDPDLKCLHEIKPDVLIDATLAKKNMGIHMNMASLVIGLGPGFTAGKDVHAVVETKRGHYLGKVYYQGCAESNTGVPGEIAGFSSERVLRSPCSGKIKSYKKIGDKVKKGDVICKVENHDIKTTIDGVLRGLIKDGLFVNEGLKIGDVDPRGIVNYCFSISDKARAVAGGALEAVLSQTNSIS